MTSGWLWVGAAALAIAVAKGGRSTKPSVSEVAQIIQVTQGSARPRPDGRPRTEEYPRIARAAIRATEHSRIPLAWLLAVGYYESHFRPEARSSANAVGVWQHKPQYTAAYSDRKVVLTDVELMTDLDQAARVAVRKFEELLRRIGSEGRLSELRGIIPAYANEWWLAAGYYNKGRSGFHNLLAERGGWEYADKVTALAAVYQAILNGEIPRDQWREQIARIRR